MYAIFFAVLRGGRSSARPVSSTAFCLGASRAGKRLQAAVVLALTQLMRHKGPQRRKKFQYLAQETKF